MVGIRLLYGVLFCWVAVSTHAAVLFQPQGNFQPLAGQWPSVSVNLTSYYNNRAFGMQPNDANFDGNGNCYPAQDMPPAEFTYSGVNYSFPTYRVSGDDNVRVQAQVIPVPQQKYVGFQMLATSESGMASGNVVATYADGSTSSTSVLVPQWWSGYPSGGALVFPYYLTKTTVSFNRPMIYQTSSWVDPSKELVSLTLPAATNTPIHIFSLSMLPAIEADSKSAGHSSHAVGPQLEVLYARSTQKWIEGTDKVQVVEVQVRNVGAEFVLREHQVRLRVHSPGLDTVVEGKILRLGPGDQVTVQIGVRPKSRKDVDAGSSGPATIVISGHGPVAVEDYTFDAVYGIQEYEATYESIFTHESPDWYSNAKFGIFIHWGIYSVPGWSNSTPHEVYAEWYWHHLNQGPNFPGDIYDYHLRTYGPNVVYDDFIQNFTADAWDPKEWVDLFADAGANYFVQVTKHHDGYALFDVPETATKRTSVQLFPHRNLLQELFDAAKKYQPHLHRATYLSLPEWYNPAFKPYGFASWPGGNASNPFTNQTLPYTGYVAVDDYLTDTLLPEMTTLAAMGTEIMWCDIGGPNVTTQFAASWYNTALSQNRQVAMNDRCGIPGDFDTPEYAKYSGSLKSRKWESNLGMDPHSFGYNRATPLSAYMNATTLVTNLVDIVSKNGNFLLDVGPTANGTIIDVQQKTLREAGAWIKSHAEAIYDTKDWFVTPQEGSAIRFTIREDAFYIHSLVKPEGPIVLESPVPWVNGDRVTVVGGKMAGQPVEVHKMANGSLVLDVTSEMADADQFAWVFKIAY